MYDIVFIGNYTKDTIVSASGTRVVDGGGFNYGAHAAAVTGPKIAVVTRLAQDDFHVLDTLKRLGVEVFAEVTPQSTRLRLEYPTPDPDQRILTMTSTAGSFSIGQILGIQSRTFVINASIRGEVPEEVVKKLQVKGGLLVLDVQGFVRVASPGNGRIAYGPWPEMSRILGGVDILKADSKESEMLTEGEKNLRKAAKMLAGFGPKEIVLTHQDGVMVYAQGRYHEAGFFPREMVGRSGRGDTCIGAYVAARILGSPAQATIWAAAVTSLKLEAEGPVRSHRKEVEDLIRMKYTS